MYFLLKNGCFEDEFPIKMVVFHCYVSVPGGRKQYAMVVASHESLSLAVQSEKSFAKYLINKTHLTNTVFYCR